MLIGGVMPQEPQLPGSLYRKLANRLIADISSGAIGERSRLPGERDLAIRYGVSRGTVREAVIVLEVMGVVQVRIGSGAHILRSGQAPASPQLEFSAFEIAEALLMIEGEAAALAAKEVNEPELAEMAAIVHRLERWKPGHDEMESLDRDFHLVVARASRNHAVYEMIARLWDWRGSLSDASKAMQRTDDTRRLVARYTAVMEALRAADPNAARSAMRVHLAAVLDGLALVEEELAVEEARRAAAARRSRYITAVN